MGERTGVGKVVVEGILQGNYRRSLSRDLNELYDFYLDGETRARVAAMGRLRRWASVAFWLLKSCILRLTPARRLLFLVALGLSLSSNLYVGQGGTSIEVGGGFLAFPLLLAVLMLELKDKLLARDEIEIGRVVQLALMPTRSPDLAGWDIWLYTRPANDVGGDLVDTLPLAPGRLGVALGDVSGKGLGAALLMAKLQSTLRALATEPLPLAGLGERVNGILCRDGIRGRFATLVYIEVEAQKGHLRVLNAGHPPPLVIGARGLRTLPPIAYPLGVKASAEFVEQSLEVDPGDLVLLYSDGVTEAMNLARELYGSDRLLALAPTLHGLSSDDAGRRILAAVADFVGVAPANDDLSLIVMRRLA